MPDRRFSVTELQTYVDRAGEAAKAHNLSLLPIIWNSGLERIWSITMDDDELQMLDAVLAKSSDVFYHWVEYQPNDDQNPEKIGLHLYAHGGEILKTWELLTPRWDELSIRAPTDQEEALGSANMVLAAEIEKSPASFAAKLARISIDGYNRQDLTLQPWMVYKIGDNESGFEDLPWDAIADKGGIKRTAMERIEAHLAKETSATLASLAAQFPPWHAEAGRPRLTKALVGMFAEEQGFKVSAANIDALKARIDVAMAKAR